MTTRHPSGGTMKARSGAARIAALAVFIIVILVATPFAQQPTSFSGAPGAMTGGPAAAKSDATEIDLLVGRSTIVNVGSAIARVSLTVPANAHATAPPPPPTPLPGTTPG